MDLPPAENGGTRRPTERDSSGDVSNLALVNEIKKPSAHQNDMQSDLATLTENMNSYITANTKAMTPIEVRMD